MGSGEPGDKGNKHKNKTNRKRCAGTILALLLLLGCAGSGEAQYERTAAPEDGWLRVEIEDEQDESGGEKMSLGSDEEREESLNGVKVAAFKELNVRAGSKEVRVELENPAGNECYMRFVLEIVELNEGGEIERIVELYRTAEGEYVKPGERVERIELNMELEAGEYEGRLITYFYDADSKNEYQNISSMQFKLNAIG
ncbi:MAG: hypothetical protein Q4C04_01775 [Clostridia bacterium]|nr:hypothetical protein [Clostridia bacterium]